MHQRNTLLQAGRILFVFLCALVAFAQFGRAQRGTTAGEWRHYGGDAGGTKYSPLDQMENVEPGAGTGLQLAGHAAHDRRHPLFHGRLQSISGRD